MSFDLVDLADTRLKGAEHFASQGMEYLISALVVFVLYIFAMLTKNKKFHGGFSVLSLLYMISWAFRYHETIW